MKNPYVNLYQVIAGTLDKKLKNKSTLFIVFVSFAAFTEILTTAALKPIINIVNNGKIENTEKVIDTTIDLINTNFGIYVALSSFLILLLISTIVKMMSIYYSTSISNSISAKLTSKVVSVHFSREYINFYHKESDKVISAMMGKIDECSSAIISIFNILISSFIGIFLVGYLFLVDPFLMALIMLLSMSYYIVLYYVIKKKLIQNSIIIANAKDKVITFLNNGSRSIKSHLLEGSVNKLVGSTNNQIDLARDAYVSNKLFNNLPRYVLEFLALTIVLLYSSVTSDKYSIVVVVFGLFRALPLIQSGFIAFSTIQSTSKSVSDINELLNQELLEQSIANYSFNSKILLNDISFERNGKKILSNVTLEITRGKNYEIKGPSGSGKSTLIDIITGLLSPSSGKVYFDNVDINNPIFYRKDMVGYIGQDISLNEGNLYDYISDNGVNDKNSIDLAVSTVGLKKTITFDNLSDIKIQERGSNFSGGQKQRIAIARILARNPSLIILDEALGQIDTLSSSQILNQININYPESSIILVTHRGLNENIIDYKVSLD